MKLVQWIMHTAIPAGFKIGITTFALTSTLSCSPINDYTIENFPRINRVQVTESNFLAKLLENKDLPMDLIKVTSKDTPLKTFAKNLGISLGSQMNDKEMDSIVWATIQVLLKKPNYVDDVLAGVDPERKKVILELVYNYMHKVVDSDARAAITLLHQKLESDNRY